MKVKTFKDLIIWQKAHSLVLEIYKITGYFPSEEKFGLISQIRRSGSSIPANISEGYKKKSQKEFLHFLNTADCSLEETKYHLILSRDLGFLKEADFQRLSIQCDEVGKILHGFQRSLSETF